MGDRKTSCEGRNDVQTWAHWVIEQVSQWGANTYGEQPRLRVTVEAEPFDEEQPNPIPLPHEGDTYRDYIGQHWWHCGKLWHKWNPPVALYGRCPHCGESFREPSDDPPAPTLEEALRVVQEAARPIDAWVHIYDTHIEVNGDFGDSGKITPAQAAEKLHELAEERKPKMTPAQAWAAMRPLLGDEAGSKYLALLSPETLDVLDEHFAGTCA